MARAGRQVLRYACLAIVALCGVWYFGTITATSNTDINVLVDDDVLAQPFNSRITSSHLAKRIPAVGLSYGAHGQRLIQYMEEENPQRLWQRMWTDGVLTPAQITYCTSQTVFTHYSDLRVNGWERNPPGQWHPDQTELEEDVFVLAPFQALGISTSVRTTQNPTGSNEAVIWEQNQVVFNGQQVAKVKLVFLIFAIVVAATGAFYKILYNTRDGIMGGMMKEKPTERRNEDFNGPGWRNDPQLRIPDLHRSSDVVSLEWDEYGSGVHIWIGSA
ncbi:hypothetical protein BST61_g9776 [Cercospora zeina]